MYNSVYILCCQWELVPLLACAKYLPSGRGAVGGVVHKRIGCNQSLAGEMSVSHAVRLQNGIGTPAPNQVSVIVPICPQCVGGRSAFKRPEVCPTDVERISDVFLGIRLPLWCKHFPIEYSGYVGNWGCKERVSLMVGEFSTSRLLSMWRISVVVNSVDFRLCSQRAQI